MKKKLKGKLLSLLLAAVLCISLFPVSAGAQEADSLVYLALGDSITSGYRLDDASTECFVPQFAETIGATTAVNQGVDGLTAAALAAALSTGAYDAALASADVITLTIGGNDLLAAFYQVLAEAYNTTYATYISMGFMSAMDANTVKTYLSVPSTYSDEVSAIITLLNDESVISYLTTSTTMSEAVTACIANITAIVTYMKSVNSDVIILVANQYNPYQWLPTAAIGNVSLENVITYFGTVSSTYNSYLALTAAGSGAYTVVDVAGAFAASEDSLTNAAVTVGFDMATLSATYSFDFDIHPNADGHKVIADTMTAAYAALTADAGTEDTESEDTGDAGTEDTETENTDDAGTEDTETENTEGAGTEDTESEDTGDAGTGNTDDTEKSGTEASGESKEDASGTGNDADVDGADDAADTNSADADDADDDVATDDAEVAANYLGSSSADEVATIALLSDAVYDETDDVTIVSTDVSALEEGVTYVVVINGEAVEAYVEDGVLYIKGDVTANDLEGLIIYAAADESESDGTDDTDTTNDKDAADDTDSGSTDHTSSTSEKDTGDVASRTAAEIMFLSVCAAGLWVLRRRILNGIR